MLPFAPLADAERTMREELQLKREALGSHPALMASLSGEQRQRITRQERLLVGLCVLLFLSAQAFVASCVLV